MARDRGPLIVAVVAAAALIATYLALGGATYSPLTVADPCKPRPVAELEERTGTLQQIGLSALDGAACDLRVTREDLVLALASEDATDRFLRERRIDDRDFQGALRAGLERAVDDAARADRISGLEEFLLRQAVERVPIGLLLSVLERASGRSAVDVLGDLLRG
jgi:hypothetical protein